MAANRLKEILDREGISLHQLTTITGIKKTTLRKVCNQRRDVAPSTKVAILVALETVSKNQYTVFDIYPKVKRKELRYVPEKYKKQIVGA